MISIDKALNCYYVIYRNLSYGRQNDENKRAIKNAGGITALVRYVPNHVIAMLDKIRLLKYYKLLASHTIYAFLQAPKENNRQ